MNDQFRGFTGLPAEGDFYAFHRHQAEAGAFMATMIGLLGPRIAAARPHSGHDGRGGRDYYFDNVEFHIRGRRDPCFLGFYHYRAPDTRRGDVWEVWEWEHDDEPIVQIPVPELLGALAEARDNGRLSAWLDDHAATIRHALGLE